MKTTFFDSTDYDFCKAISKGNRREIQSAIRCGAKYSHTAFFCASEFGNIQILAAFFCKVKLSQPTIYKALELAIEANKPKSVRECLPHARKETRVKAMFFAAKSKNQSIVKDIGATLSDKNQVIRALHLAILTPDIV